jgi:hypothetical protein
MDLQTNPFSVLSFIVAPAVLTNASAVLTLSTSNRLARAVDRARELTTELEHSEGKTDPTCHAKLRELEAAQQRMLMLIRALKFFYVALGSFAGTALLSLIGALLTPALPSLTLFGEVVAVTVGSVAVGALVQGALLLVRETSVAVEVMEERARRIQVEFRSEG